ncbi:hypothetical protein ACOSQ3_021045 [Xanthoceras sorbifolium]
MTKEIGQFLGEQLGVFKEIDLGASGDNFGKYLRVRVSIDISKPLRRILRVNFSNDGKETVMLLRYERLLEYCFHCGAIRHTFRECSQAEILGNEGEGVDKFQDGSWLRATSPTRTRQASYYREEQGGKWGEGTAPVNNPHRHRTETIVLAPHGSASESVSGEENLGGMELFKGDLAVTEEAGFQARQKENFHGSNNGKQ